MGAKLITWSLNTHNVHTKNTGSWSTVPGCVRHSIPTYTMVDQRDRTVSVDLDQDPPGPGLSTELARRATSTQDH